MSNLCSSSPANNHLPGTAQHHLTFAHLNAASTAFSTLIESRDIHYIAHFRARRLAALL